MFPCTSFLLAPNPLLGMSEDVSTFLLLLLKASSPSAPASAPGFSLRFSPEQNVAVADHL